MANKQKEFANKYNEIVDLTSNDKYSDIKDAIKELMKPLKDDVENSNDTDFIGQKTEQLTTDNYAQKVKDAIAKHNEVDSKINELNNAKNTEYANYPEAKQILQNAVDKYNNSTLNSDDIDPQISDKNVLNPQNYTNIINELDKQKLEAQKVKQANKNYNNELATVLTDSDFVGYDGAKAKYEAQVQKAKDDLAAAIKEANLDPAKLVEAYNNAKAALELAKENVAKNKAIDDFNKKVKELNEVKDTLSAAPNSDAYSNLIHNIDQSINSEKENVDFDDGFAAASEEQIKAATTKLGEVKDSVSTKQNAVDKAINLYNDPGKSEIDKLIKNDIDKEKVEAARDEKNAVKKYLEDEIKKADKIISDVNEESYTALDQEDAYEKAYKKAKGILDKALSEARKRIAKIDEVKEALENYEHNSKNIIPGYIEDWTDPKYNDIKANLNKIKDEEDDKWLPISKLDLETVDVKSVETSTKKIIQASNDARLAKAKKDFDTEFNSIADIFKKPEGDTASDNKYDALRKKIIAEMQPTKDQADVVNVDDAETYADADHKVNQVNELQQSLAQFKQKANLAKEAFDNLEAEIAKTKKLNNDLYTQNNDQNSLTNAQAYNLIKDAIEDNLTSTVAAADVLTPTAYENKITALKQAVAKANEINEAKKAYETELGNKATIDDSLPETKVWYDGEIAKIGQTLATTLSGLSNTRDENYVANVKKAYSDAENALTDLKTQIALKSAQEKHRQAVEKLEEKQKELNVDTNPQLKGLNKQINDLIDQSKQTVKTDAQPNPYEGVSIETLDRQSEILKNFTDSVDDKVNEINDAKDLYDKAVEKLDELKADAKYKDQQADLDQAKTEAAQTITDAQDNETVDAQTYKDQADFVIDSVIDQANDRFTKLSEKATEFIKNNDLQNNQRYEEINQTLRDKIAQLQQGLPNKIHDDTKDKIAELGEKITQAETQYDELQKAIDQAEMAKAKADYDAKKSELDNEANGLDEYPETQKWAQAEIKRVNDELTQKIAQLDADQNSPDYKKNKIQAYKDYIAKLDQVHDQIQTKKAEETEEAKQAYNDKLAKLDEITESSDHPSRKYIKDKLEKDKTSITGSINDQSTPKAYNDAANSIDTDITYANEQFPIADKDKEAVEAYDVLKEQVKKYLKNDIPVSSPEYNKIRTTLEEVEAAQSKIGSSTNDPYPKAAAANEAKKQLEVSFSEAKKQKALIDAAKEEYDEQIVLIDQLVTKPEYAEANQVDPLNTQKTSSQTVISQEQNSNQIEPSDYKGETAKLKEVIQNAAVAVYNKLEEKVAELLNDDNLGDKTQYATIKQALAQAKNDNNSNGTNNQNPYETINDAYDNLDRAYKNALDESLKAAKNQFNTDKQSAESEITSTDPAYQSASDAYKKEVDRIQGVLDGIDTDDNPDKNAKRKAYEKAISELAAAKEKFASDKAAIDAAKKAEYDNKVNEINNFANTLDDYPDAKQALLDALKNSDEVVGRDTDARPDSQGVTNWYPEADKTKQTAPNFNAQLPELEKALTEAKKSTSDAAKKTYEAEKAELDTLATDVENESYPEAKATLRDTITSIDNQLKKDLEAAGEDLDKQRQAYEKATRALKTANDDFEKAKNEKEKAKYETEVDKLTELKNALSKYPEIQKQLQDALDASNQVVGKDGSSYDPTKATADNFIQETPKITDAIDKAKQDAKESAKTNYDNDLAAAKTESTNTTDPSYDGQKADFNQKIAEIEEQLKTDISAAVGDNDKIREAYEKASKAVNTAKDNFVNSKNSEQAQKNKKYIELAKQVQEYLKASELSTGYDDIKKTLNDVKKETDKTSGVGKQPSLEQATKDYNDLNTAFENLKTQEQVRREKIKDKNNKDSQFTTTLTNYSDPKYANIKSYLESAKTSANTELSSVLGDDSSTTDAINTAYDAYTGQNGLQGAIEKAAAAKEFKDKYDAITAPLAEDKYSAIKTAIDNIAEVKAGLDGLDDIANTNKDLFKTGTNKLNAESSNINSVKDALDNLITKINNLKSLATPTKTNTDITEFHNLVNTDDYANSLKNQVSNALSLVQYSAPTTTASSLATTNSEAVVEVNGYNSAIDTATKQFDNESDAAVKQKAKALFKVEYDKVVNALRKNIDDFKNTGNKTALEIGQKIKEEYKAAKEKLVLLNSDAAKYLAKAKAEIAVEKLHLTQNNPETAYLSFYNQGTDTNTAWLKDYEYVDGQTPVGLNSKLQVLNKNLNSTASQYANITSEVTAKLNQKMTLVENKINSLNASDTKTRLTEQINSIKTNKSKQNYNELAKLYKEALDQKAKETKLQQLNEKINQVKDILQNPNDHKDHLRSSFNANSSISELDAALTKVDDVLEREKAEAKKRAKEEIEKLPNLNNTYGRQSKLNQVDGPNTTTEKALELEKEAKEANKKILEDLTKEINKMPANARGYLNEKLNEAKISYDATPNATDHMTIGDKLLELQTLALNTVNKSNEFNTEINKAFVDRSDNTINVSKYRDVLQKSFRDSDKANNIEKIELLIKNLPTLKNNYIDVENYFKDHFWNDDNIDRFTKNVYKEKIENITKDEDNPESNSYISFDLINNYLKNDADSILNQMKFVRANAIAQKNIDALSQNDQKTSLQTSLDNVRDVSPENIKVIERISESAIALKTKLNAIETKVKDLDARATNIKNDLTSQWNQTSQLGNNNDADTTATAYGLDKKVEAIKTELDLTAAKIDKVNDKTFKSSLETELGNVHSTITGTDQTIKDLQTIKNKASNWLEKYEAAKTAVNELSEGNEKTRLNNELNRSGKSLDDLKRILKDAKIDKVLEKTSIISPLNPKKTEIESELNQLKRSDSLDVPSKELKLIEDKIDAIFEVVEFAPTETPTYTKGMRKTFEWKKKDVVGHLKLNQYKDDYINKWIYLVATDDKGTKIVSQPIQYASDQLKFTFRRSKLIKDGVYHLSKVVIAENNNENDATIIAENQKIITTQYATQSDFKVINNGDIKAENVTLLFRNLPTNRPNNNNNQIALIEAANNNEIILSGFKTENITLLDNSISLRLKGLAEMDKDWSYVRTKEAIKLAEAANPYSEIDYSKIKPKPLEHNLTINNVRTEIDPDGNIQFKFSSENLKALYTYNVESISFDGYFDNEVNNKKTYVWQRANNENSKITFINNNYIANIKPADSYLFSNYNSGVLSNVRPNLNYGNDKSAFATFGSSWDSYNPDAYADRLNFSNNWTLETFARLLEYLNNSVPQTGKIYESTTGQGKLDLREKWIDFIANSIADKWAKSKLESNSNWYFKSPTDTWSGSRKTVSAIQLGYKKGGKEYNDLFQNKVGNKAKLAPVLGGRNLIFDLQTIRGYYTVSIESAKRGIESDPSNLERKRLLLEMERERKLIDDRLKDAHEYMAIGEKVDKYVIWLKEYKTDTYGGNYDLGLYTSLIYTSIYRSLKNMINIGDFQWTDINYESEHIR
ncbi:hypothetical protein NXS15_03395 [Mycoplasma sp. CSL7475-4]|uniref:hypothetical protein n=1 Tax=Mycoplasma sp. CSL7475-4 TaxID=2973942 RepID=UPI00216AB7C5|nr:hypothetical protein [Mycoplasma sp. CSL7475-4]MCS4537157.1 hypothetical protein [Mycoplasma sp. CSL7475-4]